MRLQGVNLRSTTKRAKRANEEPNRAATAQSGLTKSDTMQFSVMVAGRSVHRQDGREDLVRDTLCDTSISLREALGIVPFHS